MDMILVHKEALNQVLRAVDQPLEQGHLIRELQVTRNLPGGVNPINILLNDYEHAAQQAASKTIVYTKSEMEAMMLYARMKGSMNSNDDPEEGIRFFTNLVDRIREERSVLAIRNPK